ncbi:MAG: flagellar basal-body rod protein FlgF [Pseudomonadota bacterium]
MDRLIYTAMTGAKHIMAQQANTANNLANLSTTGFRAQLDTFRAVPVVSDSLPTRAFVVDSTMGADFTQGALHQTGRELDVALQGKGWIAVQLEDGSEAYTRQGSLKTNENGVLQTSGGQAVLGEGGPLSIPPDVNVTIASDGTISTTERAGLPGQANIVGRIKLVNPPEETLERGDDGLFRIKGGGEADADATVRIASNTLEGSNVNPVEAMVNMISLGRQFEMHMSLLKNAESNAAKASQLMAMG